MDQDTSFAKPGWNPKWRKRKKSTSDEFDATTEDKLDALRPLADNGLFCKARCLKWKRWVKIEFTYEQRGEDEIWRLAWCKDCDNLIKEEIIL